MMKNVFIPDTDIVLSFSPPLRWMLNTAFSQHITNHSIIRCQNQSFSLAITQNTVFFSTFYFVPLLSFLLQRVFCKWLTCLVAIERHNKLQIEFFKAFEKNNGKNNRKDITWQQNKGALYVFLEIPRILFYYHKGDIKIFALFIYRDYKNNSNN